MILSVETTTYTYERSGWWLALYEVSWAKTGLIVTVYSPSETLTVNSIKIRTIFPFQPSVRPSPTPRRATRDSQNSRLFPLKKKPTKKIEINVRTFFYFKQPWRKLSYTTTKTVFLIMLQNYNFPSFKKDFPKFFKWWGISSFYFDSDSTLRWTKLIATLY